MKFIKMFYKFIYIFFCVFIFGSSVLSKEFIIKGNKFSDNEAILSLIGDIDNLDDNSKYNHILKELNKSGLFKNVEISSDNDFIFINVTEYPSINNFFYNNNERIKSEEIDSLVNQMDIFTLSDKNINNLIDELKKIYQSFGYNNIKINSRVDILDNYSGNLYLEFDEGKITKIKKINFFGNSSFDNDIILSKIKSKTKKLTNIFINNNFKIYQIENDLIRMKKFYLSQGYSDITIKYDVEFFNNNKVIINFYFDEGTKYYFSNISIKQNTMKDKIVKEKIDRLSDEFSSLNSSSYSISKLEDLEFKITDSLRSSGQDFFQIKSYNKITDNKVDILFEILPAEPLYINQINISGNSRTFDYVIRRELSLDEGDPINKSKIKEINKKLNRLSIFKSVKVDQISKLNNKEDLSIIVEETQTGSFNVGLSLGTLDGASFVSGLKEKNINGTGRSLEFLINTSEDNKAFILSTTEKFILNSEINHTYSTDYKENDYTKSKSYKLNTLGISSDFSYLLADNIFHTYGVGYELKDYIITKSATVSENIAKSSGQSMSFNFKNELSFNTLNSYFRPSNGNYIKLINFLQTPTSSSNGYIKNILTGRKYVKKNNNILSVQTKVGNIFSINNNEILSDDKFSLGGKWLRGFDNFGAGPRNSRSAYVGGNNLIVTKLDFSRPLTLNDQNPIYLNFFNDYGLLWGNKNNVTSEDEDIRASYGFGLNYYSPIGPIGFSWGYPIIEKDYDVKRMFTFSIGNLN